MQQQLSKPISHLSTIEKSLFKPLLHTLVEQSNTGNLTWKSNLRISLQEAIERIDVLLSERLNSVINKKSFKKLEASWRGLNSLCKLNTGNSKLTIKMLSVDKKTLTEDFDSAVAFDQSEMFQKLYENEFGTAGGQPFSIIVGDFEFSHQQTDLALMKNLSSVSATAFCPFLTAAAPELLGMQSWQELPYPRDLASLFNSSEYIEWQEFRNSDDSRFITLSMPRLLARLPYTSESRHVSFNFTENSNQEQLCWMNAAYGLSSCIIKSYVANGWPTAIRGVNAGGKISDLPLHYFIDQYGKRKLQCPTEVSITDRRELELSKLGLLPLCYFKNTNYAAFFGAQTCNLAKLYDDPKISENALISTRLPYLLATARFAHYLKIMARDQLGQFMTVEQVGDWLNRWILNYVNGNEHSSAALKAAYPLAEAKVEVTAIAGRSGAYQAVAWLKPWLQFEELNCSLRLVAEIPQASR